MFSSTIVVCGRVVGTWKRTFKKDAVVTEASPFGTLSAVEERSLIGAAERYGTFVGLPSECSVGVSKAPSAANQALYACAIDT
jgi:hypothetical protein